MTRAIVFTSRPAEQRAVGRTAGHAGVDQFADDEREGQAEKAGQHQGGDGADELQPVRPDVGRQPGGLAQALTGDFRAGQVVALVARVAAGTGHAGGPFAEGCERALFYFRRRRPRFRPNTPAVSNV